MSRQSMRMLFLGDLVGEPGMAMLHKWLPTLRDKYNVQAVSLNGENAAKNAKGISPELVKEIKELGVSVITSGNHVWRNRKIYSVLDEKDILLRPANYPSCCPGQGYRVFEVGNHTVAVISVQGRVFMHDDLDCPFRTTESLLAMLRTKTNIIFIDFHAEATSEKRAFACYFDGKVSGIFGTHTHIQTSDNRVMPKGTAYITDLGFSGALNSSLGIIPEIIIEKFLTQMPALFKVDKQGPFSLQGIVVDVNTDTGRATNIERVSVEDDELVVK